MDLATARAALPGFHVQTVEPLAGGANSPVFELRTAEGKAVVLKLYPESLHWKMQKEVLVYDLLRGRDLDVPVPSLLSADDSKQFVAQNFVVLTKLEGQLVSALDDRLTDDDRLAIGRQVGALLARLHKILFDEFGYVGTDGIVDPHPSNLAYMSFQFEKKLREFRELGGDPEVERSIERYVEDRRDLFAACERAVFCHNDCHSANLLVLPADGGWRVSGLLDFENVLAGDPLLDLAKAHCYDPRRSERTLAALVEGYGELHPEWRETLELYVLYHWLELWDWLASTGTTKPLADLGAELRRLSLD